MKIKNKLFRGFGLVIGSMLLIGFNNVLVFKKVNNHVNKYKSIFLPLLTNIAQVRINIDSIIRHTEEYTAGWEEEGEAREAIEKHKDVLEGNGKILNAVSLDVLNTEYLKELKSLNNKFFNLVDETIEAFRINDERKTIVMEEFDGVAENMHNTLSLMYEEIIKSVDAATAEINKDIAGSTRFNIILIVFITVTAVGINIFVSKSITDSILQLKQAAESVGNGNLNTQIKINTHDEVAELGEYFTKMTSNLKNSYEELVSMQAKLVQVGKMAAIGELSGGIAHEINNPLTGILNNVQLIKLLAAQKNDFNLNDFKELLNIVEESAVRCTKIIRSLLEFSHTAKGEYKTICLNEELEKVLFLIKNELSLQNIIIQAQLYPELPKISGDSQLIQQVFFGLISNAKWAIQKKSGNAGGIITIKTAFIPENHTIYLEFLDTGIGISQKNLEKIFDPFFTTKNIGEGTGLGLSIVYNILKAHKATIDVASIENQGTTFKITLPAL